MSLDKRKFPRARMDCDILYPTIMFGDEKKTLYEEIKLKAIDISESGIGLQSNFYIPDDSFLSFFLRIGDNLPFKTLVKIRWARRDSGEYVFGGEFIALSLQDIHIIRNYVASNNLDE